MKGMKRSGVNVTDIIKYGLQRNIIWFKQIITSYCSSTQFNHTILSRVHHLTCVPAKRSYRRDVGMWAALGLLYTHECKIVSNKQIVIISKQFTKYKTSIMKCLSRAHLFILYLCIFRGYYWKTNSIKGMKAYGGIYVIDVCLWI